MNDMSHESREEFKQVWHVINNELRANTGHHEKRISLLERESDACKVARDEQNSNIVKMCDELKTTRREVLDEISDKYSQTQTQVTQVSLDQKDLAKEVKGLAEEINKSRGRAQVFSLIPILINCAVGVGSILGMLWAVGKVVAKVTVAQ